MTALLEVRNLGRRFGGVVALSNVSFDVAAGAIVGIMGANGAGKTTLFGLIAGNLKPTTGEIRYAGQPIVGLSADRVCAIGIARTFQIVMPFPSLTVLENVRTGALFGHSRCARVEQADAVARQVLTEVGLAAEADRPASTLTLSGMKRLEIARAVATGAQLILLDEVMAGLTPAEVTQMLQTLRRLHAARDLTLLVIEHVMRALMDLCGRIVVLHHGELIAEGSPQQVGENEKVLSVYFGQHA